MIDSCNKFIHSLDRKLSSATIPTYSPSIISSAPTQIDDLAPISHDQDRNPASSHDHPFSSPIHSNSRSHNTIVVHDQTSSHARSMFSAPNPISDTLCSLDSASASSCNPTLQHSEPTNILTLLQNPNSSKLTPSMAAANTLNDTLEVKDKFLSGQNDEDEEDLMEDEELDNFADAALAAESADEDTKKCPGWSNDSVYRLIVPVLKVESILGRKGELIKKLCEETCARVLILEGAIESNERIFLISAKKKSDLLKGFGEVFMTMLIDGSKERSENGNGDEGKDFWWSPDPGGTTLSICRVVATSLGKATVPSPPFSDQARENVLDNKPYFLTSCCERNPTLLISRAQIPLELFISNCYAVSLACIIDQLVWSLVLKGMPHFNLVQMFLGGRLAPWALWQNLLPVFIREQWRQAPKVVISVDLVAKINKTSILHASKVKDSSVQEAAIIRKETIYTDLTNSDSNNDISGSIATSKFQPSETQILNVVLKPIFDDEQLSEKLNKMVYHLTHKALIFLDLKDGSNTVIHKSFPNINRNIKESIITLLKKAPLEHPPCSIFGKPPKSFNYVEPSFTSNEFSLFHFLSYGGFGSVHGGILHNGPVVAIKQYELAGSHGDDEFCSEIEVLSCTQAHNVMILIVFCVDDRNVFLWEVLINRYGLNDKHDGYADLFLPNPSTFSSSLNSCCIDDRDLIVSSEIALIEALKISTHQNKLVDMHRRRKIFDPGGLFMFHTRISLSIKCLDGVELS